MDFQIPTLKEIQTRNITDFILAYNNGRPDDEKIDPSIRNNPEGALVYTESQQSNSLYKLIKFAVKQLFLETATITFLDRLAEISRNPATGSTGNMTTIGTITTNIPLNTIFTRGDGLQYQTLADSTIINLSFSVSSITRSGNTVTVTTSGNHGLSPTMPLTISGANETDYNGSWVVESVASDTVFTYLITTTPATPATGTLLMDYDGVSIEIESIDKGQEVNALGGSELTVATPISGVDTSFVQFDELTGGTDEETDEDFRARAIEKKQNPNVAFNVAEIITQAKKVAGVTRVWVNEITPAIGQVTIYFTRDNDDDQIPSSSEVSAVKTSILLRKYAVTDDSDVIVSAPTPISVPITFSSLSPNTTEMRNAITLSLQDFFKTQTNEGENLPKTQLESIIYQTVDNSGNTPIFTLSAPAGDTAISAGELPILGLITYS